MTEAPERVAELAEALRRATSPARVSTTPPDRQAYARDLWPRGLISEAHGERGTHRPDAVVWPVHTDEVCAIVRLCAERGVPIVPFGAGSGVCGGTLPIRGGVVVDMKRMRHLSIDEEAVSVTAEAGILGDHLEQALARRGLSLGHFPSSIMCSTLGGWLAARSAGQMSSRYGKIEDMVRSVEFVDGTGRVIDTARTAAGGFELAPLLVGSEGTLGLFTRATLRLRRQPAARLLRGFNFPRVEAGCEAIRRLMQRGIRPSVIRLYDEVDTAMQAFTRSHGRRGAAERDPRAAARPPGALGGLLAALGIEDVGKAATGLALSRAQLLNRAADALAPRLGAGCELIVGCEGEREVAEAEARAAAAELRAAGGRDLGPGPGERWLAHRYDVSFGLSRIFAAGAFADTMEVAATWSRLVPLYRAVRAAVAPHAFVMAHFSHAYEDGCSIYFTFAAATRPADGMDGALARYDAIWQAGLTAATEAGGTVSHHHGVGLSKAGFMQAEHGESLRVLGALKQVLDPHGILNPGKLGA